MPKPYAFMGRSSSLLGMIFYKLMLAIIEMLAGAVCLLGAFFAKYPTLADSIDNLATDDRLDSFVKWLVHYLIDSEIGDELLLHAGLILIALGFLKIFISVGLWFKSRKMRNLGILIFASLAGYSIYHLTQGFSAIRVIALLSDLFFLYYFWRILPRHISD